MKRLLLTTAMLLSITAIHQTHTVLTSQEKAQIEAAVEKFSHEAKQVSTEAYQAATKKAYQVAAQETSVMPLLTVLLEEYRLLPNHEGLKRLLEFIENRFGSLEDFSFAEPTFNRDWLTKTIGAIQKSIESGEVTQAEVLQTIKDAVKEYLK